MQTWPACFGGGTVLHTASQKAFPDAGNGEICNEKNIAIE